MNVTISTENARGCGYRKPAKGGVGIYLVAGSPNAPCGRLPFVLDVCPCCSAGIKQTRGWTWIEPRKLFGEPPVDDIVRRHPDCHRLDVLPGAPSLICSVCPLGGGTPEGKHGLLWIGEGFYASPQQFLAEAAQMGISRKIAALPRGFKLGETWVFLAHKKAVQKTEPAQAGIFTVFKPTGVDLVIEDENKVPEKAERLAEAVGEGARIIKVVRAEQTEMFPDQEEVHP